MSDRELLELAAKAAGIGPLDFDYAERDGHGFYCGPRLPMPQGVVMAAMHRYWNPLTDDGDALRLAVKLMLAVTIGPCQVRATSISGVLRGEFPTEDAIFQDMGAATRRAIVRSAAEIGKQL